MVVWTRSMISSPQDTFSRELLQLFSTDCTPRLASTSTKQEQLRRALMWELAFAFSSRSHLTNSRHGRKRERRNFWQRTNFAGTRSNRSLPRIPGVIDETKSEGHCELQDKPLPMARVGKRGWSGLVSLPPVSHSRTLPSTYSGS